MKTLPTLDDQAVVRLSRQGGVAMIQALSRPREIEFAQCNLDQRARICSLLEGCLPLTSPPPAAAISASIRSNCVTALESKTIRWC